MPLTRALRARGIAAPCIPGSSYSCGDCSSCSSCSNTFLRKFNTSAHNSSSERKQCSSGTTTATSDSWRGTHRHHQHHQRWQKHQQQIRNKEQQLLSAAAKRWQQLWHAGNPHAPQPFNSVNNSSNSCSGRTSGTEWWTSRNSGNSGCKDVVHVVLLNLGSPLRPTYTAVWRYLKRELLHPCSKGCCMHVDLLSLQHLLDLMHRHVPYEVSTKTDSHEIPGHLNFSYYPCYTAAVALPTVRAAAALQSFWVTGAL